YVVTTIVPILGGQREPPPTGGLGTYECVFVFCVPGVNGVLHEIDLDEQVDSGDSLIVFGGTAKLECSVEIPGIVGDAVLEPNKRGRLARGRAQFVADDFRAAEKAAYQLFMPFLSACSYTGDVAVEIRATLITELATGVRVLGATSMGKAKAVALGMWPTS